jgi:hypothetical protein
MGDRTVCRTLSPGRTAFWIGIDQQSHLGKVPGKRWTATHVPCDFVAIRRLRCQHLGHYLKESGVCQDVPLSKILHFIRSVELLWGSAGGGGGHRITQIIVVQGPVNAHPSTIQKFIGMWPNHVLDVSITGRLYPFIATSDYHHSDEKAFKFRMNIIRTLTHINFDCLSIKPYLN